MTALMDQNRNIVIIFTKYDQSTDQEGMDRMDSLQISYFLKVAETEHMTNAAKALHVSQPALSRSIRMLEEDLGVKLFDRLGRRLVLNDNGRRFYASAIQFERELHNLRSAPQPNTEVTGELVVQIRVDNLTVMQAVADFCRQYPGIRVTAVTTNGVDSFDPKWDFVLDAYNPLFSPAVPGSIPLFEEPYLLAVPEDFPLFDSTVISLTDARDYPFVLPTEEQELTRIILAYCHRFGFRPVCRTDTNSYLIMLSMVAQGGCVALVPQMAPAISSYPRVKLLPLREQVIRRTVYLQPAAEGEHTAAQDAFRSFLLQKLQTAF